MIPLVLACLATTDWYVDVSAPAGGNGSAAAPFALIQDAIDAPAVVDGDTIHIAPGIYDESIVVDAKALTLVASDPAQPPEVAPSAMSSNPLVVGNVGAPGLELRDLIFRARNGARVAEITSSDVRLFEVELVGPGNCSFSCDTAYGVLAHGGADVVITGGRIEGFKHAPVSSGRRGGAGLRVEDAAVSVTDCTIEGNGEAWYGNDGGAAYVSPNGALSLRSCVVSMNAAYRGSGVLSESAAFHAEDSAIRQNGNHFDSYEGGGLWGMGLVERCTIVGNSSLFGGGVYGAFELEDCLIANNVGADGDAIAPAVYSSSQGASMLRRCVVRSHGGYSDWIPAAIYRATVVDCVVENNTGTGPYGSEGGAVDSCTCTGTVFRSNRAESGAGSYFPVLGGAAARSTLTRCLLVDNTTIGDGSGSGGTVPAGGAAYDCVLEACVLAGNESDASAALVDCVADRCVVVDHESSPARPAVLDSTLTNCIIWHNGPVPLQGTVASWSCLDVVPAVAQALGAGNFTDDPVFWSESGRDFRLFSTSPCIDAGDPQRSDSDGSRLDVGAFPFDANYAPSPVEYCTPKTDVNGCTPTISATGTPSAQGGVILVYASGVAGGQFGLFFLGTEPASAAHLGGQLCVGGTLQRSDVVLASGTLGQCDGQLHVPFSSTDWAALGYLPGDSIFVQGFYRAAPAALPDGAGLTGGLFLVLAP